MRDAVMPTPTGAHRRTFTRSVYRSPEDAAAYRRSCVFGAVMRSTQVGQAVVTPPQVTETETHLTVTFGTVRASTLTSTQRATSSVLRDAWELT